MAATPVTSNHAVLYDDVLAKIGEGWFQTRLLLVCGVGFASAAVEICLTGFLFVELRRAWKVTEYQLALIPVCVSTAAFIGQLLGGWLADRFGRRCVFIPAVFLTGIFGLASASADDIGTLIAWRVLVGLGYGGSISVDFPMFSEYLPTQGRAENLFKLQAFFPIGQICCCGLAWAVIPTYGWKAFLVACAFPSLVVTCLRPLIPESPRWLLLAGRVDEATTVCKEIGRLNGKSPEEIGLFEGTTVRLEATPFANPACAAAISTSSLTAGTPPGQSLYEESHEESSQARYLSRISLLYGPALLKTTVGLSIYMCCLEAISYSITTLMPSILEQKGIEAQGLYKGMCLAALFQLPGTFGAAIVVSRYGRLLPMKVSLGLCGLGLAAMAWATSMRDVTLWMCISITFLQAVWGLVHTYVPEAYPTEVRATAGGLIGSVGKITTAVFAFVGASILEARDSPQQLLYLGAFFSLVGTAASLLLHVETKDRDLEDVVSDKTF